MARYDASFSVRLLGPDAVDQKDLDRALSIFVRNTSPFLRTKTNQIRHKAASPFTSEGRFYFAALYKTGIVIGFAMFGYYPAPKLVVVDHLVIDHEQRGEAAFYIFAQLLQDTVLNLNIEVDFAVVEIEESGHFGGGQTQAKELIRLLRRIGFGEVHVKYVLPNMEPRDYEARHEGVLMLKGAEKIYGIRREDLGEIYRVILLDHYLPWFRDFFSSDEIASYESYLRKLNNEFEERLSAVAIIKVDGPEADGLMRESLPIIRSPEGKLGWYIMMFCITGGVLSAIVYVLSIPGYLIVPILFAFLLVFAGVAATSSGRAFEVFERVIERVGGRRKLNYLQPSRGQKAARREDQQIQRKTKSQRDSSTDK